MSENPGFPPARIEAAARARFVRDYGALAWDSASKETKLYLCAEARRDLTAAFPEIASGEAWVAPTVATPHMAVAMQGEAGIDWLATMATWESARDAYLKDHP